MLDARGPGNGTTPQAGEVDAQTLAVARRIGPRTRLGLLPMHHGLEIMQVARRLALAFEVLGDRVVILDTEGPLGDDGQDESGRPAALERALEDASRCSQRVLVAFRPSRVSGFAVSLASAMDGVLLIARPGGTTEFRLHKLQRQIDARRRLGVLLVE
ncbi:MAG TPA: hypothetical protein VF518_13550 [Polyangia bacterium]